MRIDPVLTTEEINYFMKEALVEARKAEAIGEVPIGAVIVQGGQIIARGYNHREIDQKATAHAELLAIEAANEALGSFRLENTTLFVTLEPCVMCAGAIVNARIPQVYYGADDPKGGAVRSLHQLLEDSRLNHRVDVHTGLMAQESGRLLQQFFQAIRLRQQTRKIAQRKK